MNKVMKKQALEVLPRRETLTLINFKVSRAQLEQIEKNAKTFANGNVSKWLRYVGAKVWPAPKKK